MIGRIAAAVVLLAVVAVGGWWWGNHTPSPLRGTPPVSGGESGERKDGHTHSPLRGTPPVLGGESGDSNSHKRIGVSAGRGSMVAIDEVKREKEGNVQVERRRRKNRLVERRKSADGLKCDDTKPFSVPCGVPTPKADERIHRKRVQLWKGGPYWAETNIGAEKPWESGFYFWWGDTVGYKRENGVWVANKGSATNFSFAKEKALTCDKPNSNEWTTADGVLTSKYDAAIVQLGDGWRMPTQQELDDLCKKCDWTWTTTNGVNGYVVRGRDDYASNHIFLPCAGFGYGTSLSNFGSDG